MMRFAGLLVVYLLAVATTPLRADNNDAKDIEFFEKRIRPILVKHCYECHSEQAKEREGGLLLDRRSGWLEGGESGKAVLPGEPGASLLIQAHLGRRNGPHADGADWPQRYKSSRSRPPY